MPRWDVFWVQEFRQAQNLDEAEVQQMVKLGQLKSDDCVRPTGSKNWLRVKDMSFNPAPAPAMESDATECMDAVPMLKPVTEEVSVAVRPSPAPMPPRPSAPPSASPSKDHEANRAPRRKEKGHRSQPDRKPAPAPPPKPPRQEVARPTRPTHPVAPSPQPKANAAEQAEPGRRLVPIPPPAPPKGKIEVECPRCGKTGRISAAKRGQTVPCPGCQTPVKVEGPAVRGRQKKRHESDSMGFFEAGSTGAFITGIFLSIVFVCLGCWVWAVVDRSTSFRTGFFIFPVLGLAGLGMLVGYRGQNTLAGAVAAGVGFFGTLLARSLIGAVLLVSEVEPELTNFKTEDHETLIDAQLEKICEQRKLDIEECSDDEYAALEAEARSLVDKLSLEEVRRQAVDIRWASYERAELIDQLAYRELAPEGAVLEDEEEFDVADPAKFKQAKEELAKLDDDELRKKFDAMEDAKLRSRVANILFEQHVDEKGMEWEQLSDAEHEKLLAESQQRVANWTVPQLLEAETQQSAKDSAEAKRGLFIFAALLEMFYAFGFTGFISLFVGLGFAYKVGNGDLLMR